MNYTVGMLKGSHFTTFSHHSIKNLRFIFNYQKNTGGYYEKIR